MTDGKIDTYLVDALYGDLAAPHRAFVRQPTTLRVVGCLKSFSARSSPHSGGWAAVAAQIAVAGGSANGWLGLIGVGRTITLATARCTKTGLRIGEPYFQT